MKHSQSAQESTGPENVENPGTAKATPHGVWRRLGVFLFILVVLGCIARAILPSVVRVYVNRTLDRSPLYSGRIGEVQIHLVRGVYSIHDIRLSKTTGNSPAPLFSAKRVDFSIQWNALKHRRIVGRIFLLQPELNLIGASSEEQTQTGKGGPWLEIIRDLFPFRINSAILHDGSIHFRALEMKQPLDVYLSHIEGTIDNLGNIRSDTESLIATVQADSQVMDQAKLELRMTLDPFAYRPTFHLAVRMLGLEVTKLNDLALAYGKFDFKGGWFDLVVETEAKEGRLTGYIKPLFRNLKVFSLAKDIKEDSVPQFFWQALIGATTTALKNQPRDQFGTLIPFSGDLSTQTTSDILATLGNILRNAFVRAYLPKLESGLNVDSLQFGVPEVSAPISPK